MGRAACSCCGSATASRRVGQTPNRTDRAVVGRSEQQLPPKTKRVNNTVYSEVKQKLSGKIANGERFPPPPLSWEYRAAAAELRGDYVAIRS